MLESLKQKLFAFKFLSIVRYKHHNRSEVVSIGPKGLTQILLQLMESYRQHALQISHWNSTVFGLALNVTVSLLWQRIMLLCVVKLYLCINCTSSLVVLVELLSITKRAHVYSVCCTLKLKQLYISVNSFAKNV